MSRGVIDDLRTGFGIIQPGAGEAREIRRTGSKVEKGYLNQPRIIPGGHAEELAVRAINNARRRNVNNSALSPSSVKDK